eukprot:m.447160 g.447160  ORF g.447160 m.447160 type:complete len:702 (+) comp19477_c0_seq1:71-2176(+)
MGLTVVSWERLYSDGGSTDPPQWLPYPYEVASRLEAVFLSNQVIGQKSKLEVVEFTTGLKTYKVELATWSEVSLADGSDRPVRRDVVDNPPGAPLNPGESQLLSIAPGAKIIFTRGVVWIESRISAGPKDKPAGRLLLLRQADYFFLCWLPMYEKYSRIDLDQLALRDHTFCRNLDEFYSFQRKDNRLFATLAVGGQPSSSLPPFIFEAGEPAVKAFLAVMQMNLETAGDGAPSIKRVMDNVNMYVVEQAMTSEAVKKAAVKLVKDGLETIQRKLPEAEELKWRIMEGASAVTAYLRRAASPDAPTDDSDELSFQLEGEDMVFDSPESGAGPAVSSSVPNSDSKGAVLLGELGAFDIIGSSTPQTQRPTCPRGDPVTRKVWETFANADGTFQREAELRELIFRGGFHENVRADGWKFLLGYRPVPGQTVESFAEQKREEYEIMKRQWVSVSEVQYANHAAFRERVERVAKDVSRTDRETDYFRDAGPHLESLGAILCTWCMYNFDLGYVQGMSDLAAVILSVVDDEVVAFWCFVGLMDTVHGAQVNFATDQLGMKGHLEDLATLLRFVDPQMMSSLEASQCGNMYFTFRWLLIFLKREFSVPDIKVLWEVMWTKHLSHKYHIFMCFAILEMHKSELIGKEFDEMLQFINSLTGTVDPIKVLCCAESLCRHVLSCTQLPPKLQAFFPAVVKTDSPDSTLLEA